MKYLFFILLSFFPTLIWSQVNLQNGSAEQVFPLINYSDAKAGLITNVGLSYSSGNGLLVNEVASDVGTGWNLEAGGIIIRVQVGEPDDQMEMGGWASASINNNYGIQNTLKRYPNGFLYNSNAGSGCNVGKNYYPLFKEQRVYKPHNIVASDVEQDRFVFRVNGRSAVFVIGKDKKARVIGDSRIKIDFQKVI